MIEGRVSSIARFTRAAQNCHFLVRGPGSHASGNVLQCALHKKSAAVVGISSGAAVIIGIGTGQDEWPCVGGGGRKKTGSGCCNEKETFHLVGSMFVEDQCWPVLRFSRWLRREPAPGRSKAKYVPCLGLTQAKLS